MLRLLASALLALAVPLLLVGNGLWLLASDWFVGLLYALGTSDPGPLGLTDAQRLELARAGVESIKPTGQGIGVLVAARLPTGAPAFDGGEIAHMADVRALVRAFVVAWGVALAAALAAAIALVRGGLRREAGRAVGAGAGATLGGMALLGLGMLISFDAFFEAFHELFFAAGTWQFPADSTLLALYPYAFWMAAGGAMAALVLLQAALLVLAARRLVRPAATPHAAADARAGTAEASRSPFPA